jgi:hypothetical protein
MRFIDLDATKWKTTLDFYESLLSAIGAPKGHGFSPAALVDSMVWGGMNSVEPPYTVRISGMATLPHDVRDDVEEAKELLAAGRRYYQSSRGGDVEVAIETDS